MSVDVHFNKTGRQDANALVQQFLTAVPTAWFISTSSFETVCRVREDVPAEQVQAQLQTIAPGRNVTVQGGQVYVSPAGME